MKSVWVIEQGEYSDYRVVGVFSSEVNARMIADKINASKGYGDDATVANWPLDPAVEELQQDHAQYRVLMLRDGTVELCEVRELLAYEIAGSVRVWHRSQAPAYKGKNVPDALDAVVWAKDAKHAIKIANEHRTRLIAENKW